MAIKEVPKSYVYICDVVGCTGRHGQENAAGHYFNSRPEGWTRLRVIRDGEDQEILLCPPCSKQLLSLLDAACGRPI